MKRNPKLPGSPDRPLLIFVLALSCTVFYLELLEIPVPGFISNVTAEVFVLSALMLSVRQR
ncbi:MAG: hypothetical protein AAFV85_19125 [Cyanobacteria bacterium J06634_6]